MKFTCWEPDQRIGGKPRIALIDGVQLIEDFLDHLNVSIENYISTFKGSWVFGYIDALKCAGVDVTLFSVSARVVKTQRFTHKPTGGQICILPAPVAYRAARRKVLNPYADTVEGAVGNVRGIQYALLAALKHMAPYMATPIISLIRELRRERYEAILCQGYEHARFDACVFIGKVLGIPVFATFQGGDSQVSRIERPIRPHTLRACEKLIIGTQTEAQRVKRIYGLDPSKIVRIFNPIDLTDWLPIERTQARARLGLPLEARVVAWHGRVHLPAKGVDVLLEAWKRVCNEISGVDLRLLLIGTGKDASEIRRQIAALGLSNVIWVDRFLHDRSEMRAYLSAADVYAFPSRHEGFPVAPIEAMSCGLPIVAADAPGIPDILEGQESAGGIIVSRDDSRALAMALTFLLNNVGWARTLGARARKRVQECFSVELVGQQLRSLLLYEQRSPNR